MDSLHKKPPQNIKPCIPDHVSCLPPGPRPPPVPRRPPTPPPPPPRVPLPPPSTLSFLRSHSPFLIIMFCGLAASFLFICYLTCAMRCRTRRRNRETRELEAHEDLVNENLWPVTIHPIWLINTIGLDQSQIEAIQVFKYRKDEKVVEGTDCSICLSEFEDDESLRLLPKCSHAFHVPCIDMWLRSHKNCPLCRAPIVKNNANDQTTHAITESYSSESSSTSEETESPVNDSETVDDHHVIEVENSEEIVKTSNVLGETSNGVRVHSDYLGDHHHTQGEGLVTMRRSFSIGQLVGSKKQSNMSKGENKLNESSSSMHIRHKGTKSSSSGHSMRKAGSFTSKSRPHNQSY